MDRVCPATTVRLSYADMRIHAAGPRANAWTSSGCLAMGMMMQVDVPMTLTTSLHGSLRRSHPNAPSKAPTGIGMPARSPSSAASVRHRWPGRAVRRYVVACQLLHDTVSRWIELEKMDLWRKPPSAGSTATYAPSRKYCAHFTGWRAMSQSVGSHHLSPVFERGGCQAGRACRVWQHRPV